jgi:hypothetical protein
LGEHLESRVSQRIDRNDITGLQHRQRGDGQSVLRAADNQHLIRGDREPALFEVIGTRPLVGTAAVGLVTQHCLQTTRRRQHSQSISQQVGLPGYRWIVEIQIHYVIGERPLVEGAARR